MLITLKDKPGSFVMLLNKWDVPIDWKEENRRPKMFPKGKMYALDPWYRTLNGTIQNIAIETINYKFNNF